MTATDRPLHPGSFMRRAEFPWTSNGSGAATVASSEAIDGLVWGVYTIPGSGGSQPTDQYDLTIPDSNSFDILGGNGANRSNASTEFAEAKKYPLPVNDSVTVTIANAGDTKTGTVVILYEHR